VTAYHITQIGLQLIAATLAVIIYKGKKETGWAFISVAMCLMVARRGTALLSVTRVMSKEWIFIDRLVLPMTISVVVCIGLFAICLDKIKPPQIEL